MAQPSTKKQPRLQRLSGAATTSGPEYEWKLGGLLSLRAYKRGLQFQLFSNVEAARPLDDLVLRLLGPSDILSSAVTYFIQLKHTRPGAKEKPIGEQKFTNETGDFSLYKYFKWFKKFRVLYNKPRKSLSEDEKFLLETPLERIRLAIVTTKDVRQPPTNGQPTTYEKDFPFEEIFSTSNGGSAFTFNSSHSKIWGLLDDQDAYKKVYQKEFLGNLKIFCNQACSDELDKIIKQEITDIFGEDTEKFLIPYLCFLKQWSEDNASNFCISNEVLLDFFRQQLQISALEYIGKNLQFKPESLVNLRTALQSAKSELNISVPDAAETSLRAAKVLQSVNAEFEESSWLYLDSRILKGFNTKALITIANGVKVLITNVERREDVTKAQNLLDAIRSKDVTNEVLHVAVRTAAKGTTRNASRVKFLQDEWCLDDLTAEGQQVMLQREVDFQGKEMRLKNLETTWKSMQKNMAADLLSSEGEFSIGKRIEELEEGILTRSLSHYNMVSSRVLSEVAALNGGRLALGGFPRSLLEDVARSNGLLRCIKDEDVARVLKDNDSWHVIYYEDEPSPVVSEDFLKNLVEDKAVDVIHWVEFVSGNSVDDLCMEWRMTHGSSIAIQPFIKPMTRGCSLGQPLCVHKSVESFKKLDKALLVGPAGQGKTTTLSSLAWQLKQEEPFEWIVNVKILEHRELLRKWMEFEVLTLDHIVELLAAATVVETTGSSRSFLAAALKTSGAMSIFFDGMDEVAPVFSDLTLRVLDLLMNQSKIKRIWVACRPQVAAHLRRMLQTPPLALQDLTPDEQSDFLHSRFHSVSGEEGKLWAEHVAQLLANTGNMLGTPLHLQMASDVYKEKWTPGIKHEINFSLFELYNEFVKRKLEQYESRYTLLPEESSSFYEKNEKLAVFYLFSDEPSAKALPLNEFKHLMFNDDVLLQGKERTGIVWMEGHTVHYAHQTYAEYFAANWLFRTADSSREVRYFVRGILQGEHVVKSRLQFFLVDQLSKEWPFHAAALRCNMKAVERLIEDGRWGLEHWDRRDALLQWDFGECVRHAFRNFIKLFPEEWSFHPQWLVVAFRAAVESGCPLLVGEVMQRATLPPSTLSSALRAAVDRNDVLVTRVLVEHGVKDVTRGYDPVLHMAVRRGNLSMVDLLLSHSFDVNERDMLGNVALYYALLSRSHQHEITQRLLKEPFVDVTKENDSGQSLLCFAPYYDCVSCVKSLLRRGADVNNRDRTPPLVAAAKMNFDLLRLYLDEGAFLNATDQYGDTALHAAAMWGQMEAIQILLLRGADINRKNRYGQTPLDLATLGKKEEVVKILQNHMGRIHKEHSRPEQ